MKLLVLMPSFLKCQSISHIVVVYLSSMRLLTSLYYNSWNYGELEEVLGLYICFQFESLCL
jgi:hypothetical protein